MTDTIIFHIDVNNAFLSWEAVYRLEHLHEPIDLRQIPSAISGSKEQRHGIILAKSLPAKKYGIKTAQTIHDALTRCPQLLLVPPRHDLYETCSQAFMDILREYSPSVEPYSIDEAFMDMTGTYPLFGSPMAAAHLIKERIKTELGFTVNIGVSSNKILAKMASDFQKPDFVHSLFPEDISNKMWPLPVEELFFVGKSTAKKLKNLGIHTIGQLAHGDPLILKDHLGKHGLLIYDYANGIDSSPVCNIRPANKGYGNSHTINHDVTQPDEAKKYLLSLCETVCTRLRKDDVMIQVVSISIRDCFLNHYSHQTTLLSPTNTTTELHNHICKLFDQCWDGIPIRQLGVHTSKVTKEVATQLNFFDMDKYIRQNKVETAIDSIRQRYGDNSVIRASFMKGSFITDKTNLFERKDL